MNFSQESFLIYFYLLFLCWPLPTSFSWPPKHSVNVNSLVLQPLRLKRVEVCGKSRQPLVCNPVETFSGWVTCPPLGLIFLSMKYGQWYFLPELWEVLIQGQHVAEWLGIKKALNSVGSLSCVNLDSQLKVCRHTHTSFLAHQCLSIVFLDESQTKGRRNRKEKKKSRYQEIPKELIKMIQMRKKGLQSRYVLVSCMIRQEERGDGIWRPVFLAWLWHVQVLYLSVIRTESPQFPSL